MSDYIASPSLNDIVNINVSITPSTVYRRKYNSALIIGNSSILTDGTIVEVENANELLNLEKPFNTSSPEYKAANLYFSQDYKPDKLFVANLNEEETLQEAIVRCRQSSPEWYVCIPVIDLLNDMTAENLIAISTYIESASPSSMIAYSLVREKSVLISLLESLKEANFSRTITQSDYSTNYNNGTMMAGIIGWAMGRNKRLIDSFTLAYKSISGISATSLIDSTDLSILLGLNTNLYIKQGDSYNLFRQGKMSNGTYFDEVLYIDMLIDELRSSVMNALISSSKVPQTDEGISLLTAAISSALDLFVNIKFIQPGKWLGDSILNLKTNDMLNLGYLIQFEDINSQTLEDRKNRIAPNCYIAVKLAGAIEFLAINLQVSR